MVINSGMKNRRFVCLCVYSKACIVLEEIITVKNSNSNNWTEKMLKFKNNVLFKLCIWKVNDTFVYN